MSEENVELATAFFDAYNARDSEAVDRLLDPDAEITTPYGQSRAANEVESGNDQAYFGSSTRRWRISGRDRGLPRTR